MKALLTLAFVLVAFNATAQVRMSAGTRADIATLQAIAKEQPDAGKLAQHMRGLYPTALHGDRCTLGFLGRLNGSVMPQSDEHVLIGARIGDIVSFRIDAHHLDVLQELSWLSYVELAHVVRPALDRVVRSTRADSVHLGINLPQSYTGRDVIMGIVDGGFQYAHPMFYDTALTQTRILAAWDMSKQSGPAPAGFTLGTEYGTPAELIAAVRDTLWPAPNDYIATHGTHVAGIAAGGGGGTQNKGLAYEADILLVSPSEDYAANMDAISWLQQRALAEQKRLVVNMSWGSVQEGGDCNSLFTQALDLFSDQGVMLVAGAGNFGGGNFHLQKSFNSDTLRTRIGYAGVEPGTVGQRAVLWGDAGQPFSAALTIRNTSNVVLAQSPWISTSALLPFSDSVFVFGNDTLHVQLIAEEAHPTNGRPYLRISLERASPAYRVDMSVTATSGTVHGWNVLWYARGAGWYTAGFEAAMAGYSVGNDAYGILEPSCANGVLSVGAYNGEYQVGNNWLGGALAGFSSEGPTLDGRLKPEITAPGVNVMSSIDLLNEEGWTAQATTSFQGETYGFSRGSGTSMATPVVSGIAALLLEALPFATPAEIKQAIMNNARTDSHTGVIPPQGSTTWGMGKVNAYAMVVDLLGVVGAQEHGMDDVRVWPNPFTDELMIGLGDGMSSARYTVMDVTGRTITTGSITGRNARIASAWSNGVYLVRINDGERAYTVRVVRR
jgi:minor extracellular serine protease Vpr